MGRSSNASGESGYLARSVEKAWDRVAIAHAFGERSVFSSRQGQREEGSPDAVPRSWR